MKMVTIKVFDNPIDAHILKSKLESEGIHSYIFDEHIVSMNLLYNNAIGGVKLNVSEKDVQHAKEIIAAVENQPFTNELEEQVKCPSCGSVNLISDFKTLPGIKGFLMTVVSILFMVFPLFYKTKFKCKGCGIEFKKELKSS